MAPILVFRFCFLFILFW
uniref:Uncharacterized protein n=1 Tax=Rhizophora mucronata TaxID=61149 RepID=A0A2P2JC64_RHIMU